MEPSVKPNLGKIGEMLEDVIWGEHLFKSFFVEIFPLLYNSANTENYVFDTNTVNAKVLNINNSVWFCNASYSTT